MPDVTVPVLNQLNLSLDGAANLPPELRDSLLIFLQHWADPGEQIEIAQALRSTHGQLPTLLDYEAHARLAAGEPDLALELIERRQRRNTTIASLGLEARALLACGHAEGARRTAIDLARSYPRHGGALAAATSVLAAADDFAAVEEAVAAYFDAKPNDMQGILSMAAAAATTGRADVADTYLQRLGAGVPAGITDEQLVQLRWVAEKLGKRETAAAAELELERRKHQEFTALQTALSPFIDASESLPADPAAFYRLKTGPQAVQLTREERQRVQLEAIRHFGFDKLREGQAETIALALLRHESVLMVMPTGGGKSLCYQLPALVLPRATLVISPLIALMKDQVEGLPKAAQSRATFINSTLSEGELAARIDGVARGDYKLVYAAPERLRQRSFLHALRRAGIDLFVVDEAHCVSMWGHDFRPDYLFIQQARQALGSPPALAMTATAPPRVRDEIVEYISDPEQGDDGVMAPARPTIITLDIYRPNLHLSALQFHNEDEKLAALVRYVGETEGSGIVYVSTRNRAETIAAALRRTGVKAEAYHAGLADRGPVQDRFMSNQTRVVVATIAFGMGIDKPDIRFIVHFHPSRSLDAYYQEVGRAGRDGKISHGVLFYSQNDWANLRRWARADEYSAAFLQRVYAAVATQLGRPLPMPDDGNAAADQGQANGATAPEAPAAESAAPVDDPDATLVGPVDLRRLQQVLTSDETSVRVGVSMLERAGLLTRGFDLPREVEIVVPRRIPPGTLDDRNAARLFKGLQLGPGQNASFALTDIARFMRWPLPEAEARLLQIAENGAFTVRPGRRAMLIELPPTPTDVRGPIEMLLAQSNAVAQRRIDDVIGYATTESCRHGYISAHFGSPIRTSCPVCDNCTGVRPDIPMPERVEHLMPDDADIEPLIIDCLISLPRPVGRNGLARVLTGSLRAPVGPDQARHFGALKPIGEAGVLAYVDDLIESNRLRQYTRQEYPVLAPTLRGRIEAEAWLAEHPELADYGEASVVDDIAGSDAAPEEERFTALQKALWRWRKSLSEQLGQPAYVIMHNELMLRVAETRPQTSEELAGLPGMGTQRLHHYGAAILDIIKLTPAQEGDAALLAAQRAEADATASAARAAAQSTREQAPQVERQVFLRLQEMRQKMAIGNRSKAFEIAGNPLLKEISRRAPTGLDELRAIPGFAESGLATEATQIVTMIAAVRMQYG